LASQASIVSEPMTFAQEVVIMDLRIFTRNI
jgi:hypothetical protein